MNNRIVIALLVMLLGMQVFAQESAPKILSIDDETVIDNVYATL